MAITRPTVEVVYPESDGRPVAEGDVHRDALLGLVGLLQVHFADQPDVYVSGNNLLYYVEGDPRRSVSPDVYIVRGLAGAKRRRGTYRLWVEGKGPDWVVEVTSRTTSAEDLRTKYRLYAQLGVREYLLFDPLAEYLRPPFQVYELEGGVYQPRDLVDGVYHSRALGLDVWSGGDRLRLRDPRTGRDLLYQDELYYALQAEAGARQAAETEVARLRAELERLHGPGSGPADQ